MHTTAIYLASASPRRRELLEQIGVFYRVFPAHIDESRLGAESPRDYVLRLALAKAEAAWARLPAAERAPVLAADTTVVMGEEIFGKPRDRADALDMLARLSGRSHEVLTAIALRDARGIQSRVSSSTVTFRVIAPAEAEAYWLTGEPKDKAGAYAIQGYAAVFIDSLSGSYSGVMGLPLFETAQLLEDSGVALWSPTRLHQEKAS